MDHGRPYSFAGCVLRNVSICVCAHEQRKAMARDLMETLETDLIVSDTGVLGSSFNHWRAWTEAYVEARDRGYEWMGVVEDDADPHWQIHSILPEMLKASPAPILSGYLGTGYPKSLQPKVREIFGLNNPPTWVISDECWHHVAVFIKTEHGESLTRTLFRNLNVACDQAVSLWARASDIPVAYTTTSPFEHIDAPSVINNRAPRREARKAWSFGAPNITLLRGCVPLDSRTRKKYGDLYAWET